MIPTRIPFLIVCVLLLGSATAEASEALAAVSWRDVPLGHPPAKGEDLSVFLARQPFMAHADAERPVLLFFVSRANDQNDRPSKAAAASALAEQSLFSYPDALGPPLAAREFTCFRVDLSSVSEKTSPELHEGSAPRLVLLGTNRTKSKTLAKAKLRPASVLRALRSLLTDAQGRELDARIVRVKPMLVRLRSLTKQRGSLIQHVTKARRKGPSEGLTKKEDELAALDQEINDLRRELANPSPGGSPRRQLVTNVRNYIFGHSLLLHTANDLTNVPRWLHELAKAAGHTYGMAGQYGLADMHANSLPPDPVWGVAGVTGLWDADIGQSFAEVNFNTILFTAANFRQYYPPTDQEPEGALPVSIVASTLTVFDWVEKAEPGVRYIIYENWPDMAPFTKADFKNTFPTESELRAYHRFTRGKFHQWWLDYQDALLAQRPKLDVRMVPAGPILAELLTTILSDVPASALYEDNAPHGKATLYFLAGLVTYMAMYGVEAPADYVVPDAIHKRVRDQYPKIVSNIWKALQAFVHPNGKSRVF